MTDTAVEPLFSEAFRLHKDAITRHCRFHVFDGEIAQELAQEAFFKTWKYIVAGHAIDNIRAFLYRVATNACVDFRRKQAELSLEQLQEKGFDPGSEDADLRRDFVEEHRALATLRKLGEPYRTAVSLRYLKNLAPREIAAITGENANTVSAHIARGLKRLRSSLRHAAPRGTHWTADTAP